MLFLSLLVYLPLWAMGYWVLPQIPILGNFPWGMRMAVLVGLAFLLVLLAVFLIDTYSPASKGWWRDLSRVVGIRWYAGMTAAVLLGLIAVQLIYLHAIPEPFVLGLVIPACVVSALNLFGVDVPIYKVAGELAPQPIPEVPETERVLETSNDNAIQIDHVWEFEGNDQRVKIEIRRPLYEEYRSRRRDLDYMRWSRVYVTEGLCAEIRELALCLHRLGMPFGTYREVSLVLSFVQSVMTYQREEGEHPRFPVESLVDGVGDCEDYAILGAALLKDMGYEVALLFVPGHAALGVAGAEGLPGVFAELDGRRYYYCEMTGDGWLLGDVPEEYSTTDIQVSRVPDPQPKVVIN